MIVMIRAMEVVVDDDYEPVQDNIPGQNEFTSSNNGLEEDQSFGWNGFDERKKEGLHQNNVRMINQKDVALEKLHNV